MKRAFTLAGLFLALAAPVAFLVWDATPQTAPADGKIHLRYWTITGMKDVVPYYSESFTRVQDRIFVETTPIPWQEHEKKILTAIVSGNPADVINQDHLAVNLFPGETARNRLHQRRDVPLLIDLQCQADTV